MTSEEYARVLTIDPGGPARRRAERALDHARAARDHPLTEAELAHAVTAHDRGWCCWPSRVVQLVDAAFKAVWL